MNYCLGISLLILSLCQHNHGAIHHHVVAFGPIPLTPTPPIPSSSSLQKPTPHPSLPTRITRQLLLASNSNFEQLQQQRFTQVISDVDDTLKSSGGKKIGDIALGGIDVQYERGDFYPGVFQFMLELSLYSQCPNFDGADLLGKENNSSGVVNRDAKTGEGGEEPSLSPSTPSLFPPKVAVLTARAQEFKLALELKEDSKLAVAFRKTGERSGFQNWGLGPVLYGSVAEWVIQGRKGLRKFSNFERLLEQDPTGTIMQYVYVGDTGELDQEAGETMLKEYPEVVKAVFLHVVSETPYPRIPSPKLINGRPVVFFRTYVGAAAKACQLGLMDEAGMMRVVSAAEESLDKVSRTSEKWLDLYRDVSEAYRTLSAD